MNDYHEVLRQVAARRRDPIFQARLQRIIQEDADILRQLGMPEPDHAAPLFEGWDLEAIERIQAQAANVLARRELEAEAGLPLRQPDHWQCRVEARQGRGPIYVHDYEGRTVNEIMRHVSEALDLSGSTAASMKFTPVYGE